MSKRMSHKEKVKLARRLRSHDELKAGVPIFETRNWLLRKQSRNKKVLGQMAMAKIRRLNKKVFGVVDFK